MRDLAGMDRPLYAWTVNHPRWMTWCIRQNVVLRGEGSPGSAKAIIDGVVTDDPSLYLDVCRRYEDELHGEARRRASWGEAVGLLVDLVKRHVAAKLFFWYRRHVEGKLDHLGQRRVKEE